LRLCRMHFHADNQSQRIGHDMPLAPIYFLPAVITTLPPF
jgi:hypothetical protein